MATTMAVSPASLAAAPSFVGTSVSLNSRASLSVHTFPLKNRKLVKVTATASAEERAEQPSRTAVLLSGILGVAAAASVGLSGNAIAASGPGTSGAERTAEKAGELLQSADELTTDDSPPRFGGGIADETSKLARQAGAGADDAVQGTQGAASDKAKEAVGQAQDGVDSTVAKAQTSAPNFFSSIQESLANLTGSAPSVSDAKSAADDVASDAAANLPSPGDSSNFFGDLKSKLPGQ